MFILLCVFGCKYLKYHIVFCLPPSCVSQKYKLNCKNLKEDENALLTVKYL